MEGNLRQCMAVLGMTCKQHQGHNAKEPIPPACHKTITAHNHSRHGTPTCSHWPILCAPVSSGQMAAAGTTRADGNGGSVGSVPAVTAAAAGLVPDGGAAAPGERVSAVVVAGCAGMPSARRAHFGTAGMLFRQAFCSCLHWSPATALCAWRKLRGLGCDREPKTHERQACNAEQSTV